MSLLFNVLFAWKCTSTHHKLALDALRHLRLPDAEEWTNFFVGNADQYLLGAKAPDNDFKDFRNHVLHVRENYWGGAVAAANQWYRKTVEALRSKDWELAAYGAGVLSHYYTDPIQPFHTDQSEAEGAVHRAAEWSIAQNYDALTQMLEADLGGYPEFEVPAGDDWLADMVRAGARFSNPGYQLLIDHYNLPRGVREPAKGFDQVGNEHIARCIGHAVVGWARILERAIQEAKVAPPMTLVTLPGLLATLAIPICWVTKKMANANERALVEAMYEEYMATGKVIKNLPEDERQVRALHAEEVLKRPLSELDAERPGPIGEKFVQRKTLPPLPATSAGQRQESASPRIEKPATPNRVYETQPRDVVPLNQASPSPTDGTARWYLELDMPVERAPSIGGKTAARFEKIGVRTVRDLLRADPQSAAQRMGVQHIDADLVRDWQAQASLCLRTPGLRGHDAQILVACGIRQPEDLASVDADDLLLQVDEFVETSEGQRVLRSGHKPDLDEIEQWIASARQARVIKAA